ncbi:hypothetical protein [Veillonella sp. CHU732]|uniref:hypothetical protein n=1 Tax=Veillonella sp. CHU732 TaxID=2490949 RepID=UPI000F8D323E|nr:hypothetical protein [Veillonella sp. CHU732]
MKKIMVHFISYCFVLLMSLAFTTSVNATDIWISSSENTSLYIMDDTISYGTSPHGKWITVSVKIVKHNRVIETVFSKYTTDMWRYYTNTMRGNHTTVVIPRHKIFEYMMHRIGWTYTIRDNLWYY